MAASVRQPVIRQIEFRVLGPIDAVGDGETLALGVMTRIEGV
jgi:hypothetical protein